MKYGVRSSLACCDVVFAGTTALSTGHAMTTNSHRFLFGAVESCPTAYLSQVNDFNQIASWVGDATLRFFGCFAHVSAIVAHPGTALTLSANWCNTRSPGSIKRASALTNAAALFKSVVTNSTTTAAKYERERGTQIKRGYAKKSP